MGEKVVGREQSRAQGLAIYSPDHEKGWQPQLAVFPIRVLQVSEAAVKVRPDKLSADIRMSVKPLDPSTRNGARGNWKKEYDDRISSQI